MSMDAIKQVRDIEEAAKAKKAEAQVQAKAMVEEALRAGQDGLEEARRQAQAQVRELLAQAEAHGEETTRQALAAYQKDCEDLKARAGDKLAQAAELIVGKVVRD